MYVDKPIIITGQKFETDTEEWTEKKCIKIQKELEEQGTILIKFKTIILTLFKGNCGSDEYLAACERLAYWRFSRSQNRNVLGWQKEGIRWLLRAESVLGGGLLADGIYHIYQIYSIFV